MTWQSFLVLSLPLKTDGSVLPLYKGIMCTTPGWAGDPYAEGGWRVRSCVSFLFSLFFVISWLKKMPKVNLNLLQEQRPK